jgi:hypothetical protein
MFEVLSGAGIADFVVDVGACDVERGNLTSTLDPITGHFWQTISCLLPLASEAGGRESEVAMAPPRTLLLVYAVLKKPALSTNTARLHR